MSDDDSKITNSVNPEPWVRELDRCDDELESERGTYMARCKAIRERMKEVKDRAADDGLPRPVLNAAMKERRLIKKLRAVADGLEDDHKDLLEVVREKLGDFVGLPLGQAAMASAAAGQPSAADGGAPTGRKERAKARSKAIDALTDDDDKDLRPAFLKDKDAEAAERNTEALEGGINQLN